MIKRYILGKLKKIKREVHTTYKSENFADYDNPDGHDLYYQGVLSGIERCIDEVVKY